MPLLTLGEAKASRRLKSVAGACNTSQQFIDLVNDATRMLMNRGNWWGTVQNLTACVYNKCIAWPRHVGTVLAVNVCGNSTQIQNNWYQFMPLDAACVRSYINCGCKGGIGVMADGTSPVFQQIRCGDEFYIRAYITRQADVGKTITIYGIDSNGQTVMSTHADGIYQEGVELSMTVAYVSTSQTFRQVTRVEKEETEGIVRLYQYDATNDVLLDMAYYEPTETSPSYQVSKIVGTASCGCDTSCDGLKRVSALVKLQYVPVVNDKDIIQVENVDAVAMMMQALKLSDQYDIKTKQAMELDAVRELNLELRNRLPIDQVPVNVMPFGTATLERHGIGRMM